MKALGVVVHYEFPEQDAKVGFSEDDELVEAPGSDRPDETLRVGVAVRASGRDGDARHAAGLEKPAPGVGEQGIAVVNEMRGVTKKSVRRIEEVSSHLQ